MLNKCSHQLERISKKGLEWASRLNSDAYISHSDSWCSFNFQLKPVLAYSILTMSVDPKEVESEEERKGGKEKYNDPLEPVSQPFRQPMGPLIGYWKPVKSSKSGRQVSQVSQLRLKVGGI